MKTYAEMIREAQIEGMVDLENGCYLYSREEIIEEQKTWVNEDSSKNIDFSIASLWLTSCNIAPQPVHTAQDLFDILDNNI
jgi:hypothetical protein